MNSIKLLALWLSLLPLFGSVVAGIGGNLLGRRPTQWLTITTMALSFILSLVLFDMVVINHHAAFSGTIFNWVDSGSYRFNVGFLVDPLSTSMLVVVSFVSLLVHVYSIGYMAHDKKDQRFFCYMSAFTFAMMMLVLANNFLLLFFGWEGVGLVSYLLIGYWFERETAVFGSLKAFLVNRIADIGFVLAIAAVLAYSGTLNYQETFAKVPQLLDATVTLIPGLHWHVLTVISLLLFIGAMGKSAQMPLHVWLPESMEGPTPISALIHAATMVTAGIYMMARMSPIVDHSVVTSTFILVIGGSTALFCGILGMFAFDIKRVIAYSTLSQLGYMMVAIGCSAYAAAMFHLFTHACFKALLFLSAGSVIIAMHEEQDMRKMGGLRKYLPITWLAFLIGGLALAAIPPFSGFYSKDVIIEAAAHTHIPGATYAYVCVLLGAFVTAYYTFRALFMTFHGQERMRPDVAKKIHESPWVVTVPLIILAIPSIILGALLAKWILYSPAKTAMLGTSLAVLPGHDVLSTMAQHFHGAFAEIGLAVTHLALYFALAGIILAWVVTLKRPQIAAQVKARCNFLYTIVLYKYGFDDFNQIVFVRWTRGLGQFLFRIIDQCIIDSFAVDGSGRAIVVLSRLLRVLQSGYLYQYLLFMVVGMIVLMLFGYWWW